MNVCESVEWFWFLLLPSSPNPSGFGCFWSCQNKNGFQGPSAFPQHEQQEVTSRSFQLQCHHQILGCNIWSSGFDSGNNKSVDRLWLNWWQWDFSVTSNRPMKLWYLFDGGAVVVISSCPQGCKLNTEPVCGEAIRVCIDWFGIRTLWLVV